ncbi:hypothetical protein SDC9_180305 [bioreactor metagenome]
MQLFFVTRYEDRLTTFTPYQTASSPLDGTVNRGFKQWYINLLLKWAAQDPVSPREIARNNAVYNRQKNRNPFIDHPEWVNMIWTSTMSTSETAALNRSISVYPNPVKNQITHLAGYGLDEVKSVEIYSLDGRLVQTINQNFKASKTIQLNNLEKGTYILRTDTKQSAKLIVQ